VAQPLLAGDGAGVFGVEEREDVADGVEFVFFVGAFVRGVEGRVEAVEEADFGGGPDVVGVEVVQGEEGGGVEGGYVVFFCGGGLVWAMLRKG
jgi:hypothetical protein